MVDVRLVDGRDSSNAARINGEGEINVVVHTHPPKDEEDSALPFRQYFTDDGHAYVSGGSNAKDMRVVGTLAAPLEFWIAADQEKDIYVQSTSVVISDATATLSQFGAIAALTNGCELHWLSAELGDIVIADELTSNFEFVRLSGGFPAFGNGNNAFRANNVAGSSEAFMPYIDFQEVLGMPWGFRLRAGTNDRLVWRIRDDVSAVDRFDALAYGIRF